MVLYLIGLGLGDESDITLKGLNALRTCQHVYLEHYTAILTGITTHQLQQAYQCAPIHLADRELVESASDTLITPALTANVALLIVGDPFAATTHHDLVIRAEEAGVEVQVVHNASIVNAVAVTGLQLYSFGQIVSVPFFREGWRPDSFYDKVKVNVGVGLHTMCLLDIKVKEQSADNIAKGIKEYEPARFMTVNQCVEQLLEVENERNEGGQPPPKLPGAFLYSASSPAFGVARCGQATQRIVSGTLAELLDIDFGPPLHTVVLCGPHMHDIEQTMYERWHWNRQHITAQRQQQQKEQQDKQAAQWEQDRKERQAADDNRKRLLEQRKALERQKQQLETERRKTERMNAGIAAYRDKDEGEEEDGVDVEPLL